MPTVINSRRRSNWWRKRTTLERFLTLISIFALVVIIGLVIALVSIPFLRHIPDGQPGTAHETKICETSECVHTASSILKKMKLRVEPCKDFYQFACGTFMETEAIPEDKVSIDTFSAVTDKILEHLRDIIAEERPATDPKHFRLPNTLYKACMNRTLHETLGAQPIRKLAESIGDWPVIKGDDWDMENKWTWQETTKNFRRLGFSMDYVVDFSRGVDYKNTTKWILDVDQSSLGLEREYLIKGLNETLVLAYYDYMVDIAVLFGANRDRALIELRESLQFEMGLAKISMPIEKRRNSEDLNNLFTISQLQKRYPYIQWLHYINALLPTGLSIDEDELINVSAPSFFDGLSLLLAKTPKRVVANYMLWRMHSSAVFFLSELFRKRQLIYMTALTGLQEEEPRWKECVDFVSDSLPFAVGSLYVRKHFNDESKAIAMEMVDNIRAAFSMILDELNWMDIQTKEKAQKKLHAMTTHIGYPDELLDNKKLAKYYDNLELDEEKYFQSMLDIDIFKTDYSFNKLRLPVNKTDWEQHASPAVVNAFYSPVENSINFPAGILQGHFFNAQRPKYMNYGAIGYLIGHEITHGFDDEGRQFNDEGNLVDWWQPDTQTAYLEKARCIIEQYGNYTDSQTGLKLNGINTQGENIADNGGIKESYRAYKKWVSKHGPEPKLPGLEYTPEQLFWIAAGQTWCAKYRKEYLKDCITTDEHSPLHFRVLVPLSNAKDFSKDFQCEEGTPMNPTHKCEVW